MPRKYEIIISGCNRLEDTAGYYQNQMDTYNFLLRKNGYETEDYGFLLFYVPSHVLENGDFVFDVELVRVDVDCSKAKAVFDEAIEVLDGECPPASVDEKGRVCCWCENVK